MIPSIFKHYLVFALVFGCNILFAQSEDSNKTETSATKKTEEVKLTEVVVTDSLPVSELLKRAVNFVKIQSKLYTKTNGITVGNKAECQINFLIKPKELNPESDYTGKIAMKVVVECKDGKYRYIINQIKHIATNPRISAGALENIVPDCGSMAMSLIIWKKIKGEALTKASLVTKNIKEIMLKNSNVAVEEW
jgi:hypothetical protein